MSTKDVSQTVVATTNPGTVKKLEAELAGVERSTERRQYKVKLELTTDPMKGVERWDGMLHNESDGGIGVLSPRSVEPDSLLFVRAHPPFEPHNWVCGNVVHCTPRENEFVIGLRIHTPPANYREADESESFIESCKHFLKRIAGME